MSEVYRPSDPESEQKIDILLEEYSDNLNNWQLEFLQDLKTLNAQLTARQLEKLDEVYDKHTTRGWG